MERIDKLKDFLHRSPEDSFLQHALALEYIKIGEEEEAKKMFEAILTREPGYVGSYYHLAKLWERMGENDRAISIYKKGMEEAKKAGDNHSYGELRGGLEEIED